MSENEQKHTFKPVSGKSGGTGGKDEKALPGASFEANRANIEAWAEENERNGGKYLLSRGISLEVQKRFKVGLSRAWAHPKTLNEGGKAFYSERCIIPYSWEAYLARATNTTEAKFKALKVKATEPRDTCPFICLILASGAARHLPAHLPDTRQVSRATPARSSA